MSTTVGLDIGGTKIAGGRGRRERQDHRPRPTSRRRPQDADAIAHDGGRPGPRAEQGHEIEARRRRRRRVRRRDPVDRAVRPQPRLARRAAQSRPGALAGCPSSSRTTPTRRPGASTRFGAGRGRRATSCCVTVGTGIGGGLVFDGELLPRRAGAWRAEIGHMRVVPGGRLCGCGNRGCWEQYASGNALVREARELVAAGAPAGRAAAATWRAPRRDRRGRRSPRPPRGRRRRAGAARRPRHGGSARASPTLAAVLDPAVSSVGGGVADAGDLLLDPARAAFRAR